jgi:Na+-transporting methylmalonyl-CoA/oxaloacetate decarboxylase gamma subunit
MTPLMWQGLGVSCAVLSAFVLALWTVGKILIKQFIARLDARFQAMETARAEAAKHWDNKFAALEQAANANEQEWRRVERDVLTLKADLPLNYVRREDFVRNQTIIEAKIDGLAIKLENIALKGTHNG